MRGNERGLHVNHVIPFVLAVIKELGGASSDRLPSAPKGVLIISPFFPEGSHP